MNQTLERKKAARTVKDFERKFGSTVLDLASHAALPVAFNSELLHLIRINFFIDRSEPLPFIVEADIQLSSLCLEIDDDLYKIPRFIRDHLLQRLYEKHRHERVKQLAALLRQYMKRFSPWRENERLDRAQKLTIWHFLNSEEANHWLEKAETEYDVDEAVEQEWFVAIRKEIEVNARLKTAHVGYEYGKPIFKDYVLKRYIGEGGYGRVWLVENRVGQAFALKVLFRDVQGGQRGVKDVMRIRSNRLVRLIDYGETVSGDFCVLMEYMDKSLSEILAPGKLEEQRACAYFSEILEGLRVLEKNTIIHRDIKPSNLFVLGNIIKIGDFGTAKYTSGETLTKTRAVTTLRYSAPESFDNNHGFSADRWAAGVIFYRMLTGGFPFDGDTHAGVIGAIMMREPDFARVPEKYVPFLKKCFDKDKDNRFENADEMAGAFDRAVNNKPPVPSQAKRISFKDKRELVDALLGCKTVADRSTRGKMVDELRSDIKSTIHRDDTDKHDVMEIVKRCLDFDGGLDEFVEIVRFYEGASRNMAAVDEIMRRLTGSDGNDVQTGPQAEAAFAEPELSKPISGESFAGDKGVRVFVSHADEDAGIAGQLYDDLVAAGVSPWMASRDLLPGSNVMAGLNRAMKTSRYSSGQYAEDVFCLSVVVRDYGSAVYRVYLRDRITLGNLKDPGADIRIGSKGVKRGHGYIERRGDSFFPVPQNGECRIADASANTPLKPGHEIRIGESFLMMTASVSDRALVLDMPDPNPVDHGIRGFILMKNRLAVGPGRDADIRIPALETNISLIQKGRRFSCETGQENRAVDFGKTVDIGGAGIFLSRERKSPA